jgi:protein-tyrosine-phosphatase
MAEALLRQRLDRAGLSHEVTVRSAGVWAEEGHAASDKAVKCLAERGIDLSKHRSQPVTVTLLENADIVLVMEEAHRRSIFYMAPQHLSKVFLLSEMSGQHDDVGDPYGGEISEYERTIGLLERLIDDGMPQLRQRLGLAPSPASG